MGFTEEDKEKLQEWVVKPIKEALDEAKEVIKPKDSVIKKKKKKKKVDKEIVEEFRKMHKLWKEAMH